MPGTTHPAWQLLAARRAPLILSCLQTLFEQSQDGLGLDDALRALADMLADHANAGEFEIDDEDFAPQARKELFSSVRGHSDSQGHHIGSHIVEFYNVEGRQTGRCGETA
jgi:hypothetical protein